MAEPVSTTVALISPKPAGTLPSHSTSWCVGAQRANSADRVGESSRIRRQHRLGESRIVLEAEGAPAEIQQQADDPQPRVAPCRSSARRRRNQPLRWRRRGDRVLHFVVKVMAPARRAAQDRKRALSAPGCRHGKEGVGTRSLAPSIMGPRGRDAVPVPFPTAMTKSPPMPWRRAVGTPAEATVSSCIARRSGHRRPIGVSGCRGRSWKRAVAVGPPPPATVS